MINATSLFIAYFVIAFFTLRYILNYVSRDTLYKILTNRPILLIPGMLVGVGEWVIRVVFELVLYYVAISFLIWHTVPDWASSPIFVGYWMGILVMDVISMFLDTHLIMKVAYAISILAIIFVLVII